eukprot:tig00020553_g10560.t1
MEQQVSLQLPACFEIEAMAGPRDRRRGDQGGRSRRPDEARGGQGRPARGRGGGARPAGGRDSERDRGRDDAGSRSAPRGPRPISQTRGGVPVVPVSSSIKQSLSQGHPWVYRDALDAPESDLRKLRSATWVQVKSGGVAKYGLWDASGPIAVRLYSEKGVPDAAFFRARLEEALELRDCVRGAGDTDAYRILYGEADGVPGVVVDLYGRTAVVATYADSVSEAVGPHVVRAVRALSDAGALPLDCVLRRQRSRGGGVGEEGEGEDGEEAEGRGPDPVRVEWGRVPSHEGEEGVVVVRENGIRLRANLFTGQKTGLFLDQRENRQHVARLARGRTVLNLFSYNGGFSLAAMAGGAQRVTSVDISRGAIADARANFALNGWDPDAHEFLAEDARQAMEKMYAEGRRFGLVVIDPPSLAKSRAQRFAALRAYEKLNALALRLVAPGGAFVTASCTSQVSQEDFRVLLAGAAASAGVRLLVQHEAGQAPDHPVPAAFREARYLKFAAGRVLPVP